MNSLDEKHPEYVSSIELSKEIKKFCDKSKDLIPYLRDNTNFTEVNTEGNLENTLK